LQVPFRRDPMLMKQPVHTIPLTNRYSHPIALDEIEDITSGRSRHHNRVDLDEPVDN
jgi:hypothetical protein